MHLVLIIVPRARPQPPPLRNLTKNNLETSLSSHNERITVSVRVLADLSDDGNQGRRLVKKL